MPWCECFWRRGSDGTIGPLGQCGSAVGTEMGRGTRWHRMISAILGVKRTITGWHDHCERQSKYARRGIGGPGRGTIQTGLELWWGHWRPRFKREVADDDR